MNTFEVVADKNGYRFHLNKGRTRIDVPTWAEYLLIDRIKKTVTFKGLSTLKVESFAEETNWTGFQLYTPMVDVIPTWDAENPNIARIVRER